MSGIEEMFSFDDAVDIFGSDDSIADEAAPGPGPGPGPSPSFVVDKWAGPWQTRPAADVLGDMQRAISLIASVPPMPSYIAFRTDEIAMEAMASIAVPARLPEAATAKGSSKAAALLTTAESGSKDVWGPYNPYRFDSTPVMSDDSLDDDEMLIVTGTERKRVRFKLNRETEVAA